VGVVLTAAQLWTMVALLVPVILLVGWAGRLA
jgi:hypothetical protein